MSSLSEGTLNWHGEDAPFPLNEPIKVFSSSGNFGLEDVEQHYREYDADFYFTHFDTWLESARKQIPEYGLPYASYVIVDHYPVPEAVTNQVMNAKGIVAMSKFAKHHLEQQGVQSTYIPHGVDTELYSPVDEYEDNIPSHFQVADEMGNVTKVSIEDNYVIGMVAANHGDRKNIPNQMEAFKMFLDNVTEDAILYIHTHAQQSNGFDLNKVRESIGLPKDKVIWPDPQDYHEIGDDYLRMLYNAFDILSNCSFGESWGLTITEAMSCGTPAIVTGFSSMPEQLGSFPWRDDPQMQRVIRNANEDMNVFEGKHGLIVEPTMGTWRQKVNSKQFVTAPEDIYEAYKYYYTAEDLREQHGEKARDWVKEHYDWEDCVVPKFKEFFDEMEERI